MGGGCVGAVDRSWSQDLTCSSPSKEASLQLLDFRPIIMQLQEGDQGLGEIEKLLHSLCAVVLRGDGTEVVRF